MSQARMEQLPAVRPEYLRKEVAAMPPNTRIQTLFGIIIFLWLATFGFLVMTTTWMLINLRDIKTQKAPSINLKEL
jgi:hypothetical protein